MSEAEVRAKLASERLRTARIDARVDVLRAIRAIEEALRRVLDDDPLRGMPNLMPDAAKGNELYARRVFGNAREPLPWDGRWILVITMGGSFELACWTPRRVAEMRKPIEVEIRTEDLEPCAMAASAALEDHVARTDRTARSYAATGRLARRIRAALAG